MALAQQQRGTADRDRMTVDGRFDAPSRDRPEAGGWRDRPRSGGGDDRPGERVLAVGLDRAGERKKLGVGQVRSTGDCDVR